MIYQQYTSYMDLPIIVELFQAFNLQTQTCKPNYGFSALQNIDNFFRQDLFIGMISFC